MQNQGDKLKKSKKRKANEVNLENSSKCAKVNDIKNSPATETSLKNKFDWESAIYGILTKNGETGMKIKSLKKKLVKL